MTLCDNCGSPVTPGDAFCGVCGAFLDWSAATKAPADPEPATASPATASPATASPATASPAVPSPAAASVTPSPAVPEPAAAPPVSPSPATPSRATPSPVSPAPAPAASPEVIASPATAAEDRAAEPSPGDALAAEQPSAVESAPAVEPSTDAAQPSSGAARSDDGAARSDDGAPPRDSVAAPQRAEAPRTGEADAPPTTPAARNRAAALVVPVAEATDRPVARPVAVPEKVATVDQPGAVQPGRPVAPRPILREFTDVPGTTGETACSNCGTLNPADRAFCRKCGRSLRAEQAAGRSRRRWRLTWPKGRGRLRRLLAILAILLLVAGLVWAGVTYGPRAVDAVRDRLAKPELITPNRVTASSSTKGHDPSLVGDGLNNRFWEPGREQKPWVELTFDKPIRVLSVIVTGGVSPEQQDYAKQGRPSDVRLELWTSDGSRTEKELHLVDHAGPQTFDMAVGDVSRMRLTVESGYGLTPGKVPAIAEIEVFRRP
ncbi:hypothetical protein Acy02nite_21330 [Actinoplanes cyaneus]|uniref:Zinc-ribbon domain-containing protein n=1 Tax=Actinoplanes cyaneus TaxID=52696 RepID=A0A919M379_9ACTN|nr:hypothetical protein [Actinoplanes cyaneus]MCW2136601.1 hypothetical protein [Actinoplanes cyaneus]GID64252.1 hypothetical protein Acy02nite_21330 [Actinoplanes cyaneus]